jgi:hypothetical protein
LQEVGTKTAGPRSIFAKELALRIAAAEDEAYLRPANMTIHNQQQLRSRLFKAETEATTWSFGHT